MEYPKFIITSGGYLRLGMVTLHRELLMDHEDCLGGGSYEYDYVTNRLILSGKSYDYGPPRWSKVEVLKIPESFRDVPIIYRDSWDEETNLTAEFPIKYY